MHVILDHGCLRRLLLARFAPVEDHFERYGEEQQAAGDTESADRDPHGAEDRLAGDGEYGEDAECDERPAHRRPAALQSCHAMGQPQEDRSKARRIDGHDQRRERVDQLLISRHAIPLSTVSPGAARPLSRP